MITTAPKGTKDVLPQDSYRWQYIEEVMRRTCADFNYREVRVPTFEHTELFLRSVGDTTDIVQKEMYTFRDKGDRSITLKPEGTAGVARCFVENALYNNALPQRMYYLYSPVFRYERPQAGRLREHHQFGVEVFGAPSAAMDAEVIHLALTVLDRLGLHDLTVDINSIGCPTCRGTYTAALREYLQQHSETLCPTCRDRMQRNPLRVLDCKVDACKQVAQAAPKMVDHLCDDCAGHFRALQMYLDTQNVHYRINPMIVRGLDYYTRTVFEIISPALGAQSTVCGGGRYDGLIREVGGPATAGIGFGMGMERLLLMLEATGIEIPQPQAPALYIAPMGERAQVEAFALAGKLRRSGVVAETDCVGRSLKAQLKYADKNSFAYAAVVGDAELEAGQWKLKNLREGGEETLSPAQIYERFTAEGENK